MVQLSYIEARETIKNEVDRYRTTMKPKEMPEIEIVSGENKMSAIFNVDRDANIYEATINLVERLDGAKVESSFGLIRIFKDDTTVLLNKGLDKKINYSSAKEFTSQDVELILDTYKQFNIEGIKNAELSHIFEEMGRIGEILEQKQRYKQ